MKSEIRVEQSYKKSKSNQNTKFAGWPIHVRIYIYIYIYI